ncbi:MAG: acetyltransferase [Fibrobacteria bacterium]|nr:acetyltransferase [Fibrobacteria bacterium]
MSRESGAPKGVPSKGKVSGTAAVISLFRKVHRRVSSAFHRSWLESRNELAPECTVEVSTDLFHCRIGAWAAISDGCDACEASIGAFSQIAAEVVIAPRNHVLGNFTIHDFPYRAKDPSLLHSPGVFEGRFRVRIGCDVWVGTRAIILHGVEIGHGAVVGAGAVVARSVPPYAIVGGTPARILRYRFPPEIRERLLQLKWWEWPMEEIQARSAELESLVGFQFDDWKRRHLAPREPLS